MVSRNRSCALLERFLVAEQEVGELPCLLVAGLSGLVGFHESGAYGLEILYLELEVDDFLVSYGVYRTVHMHHVRIVEASEHVQYRVALPDVGEELVAEPLSVAGALDESRDVDYVDRGGNGPLGPAYLREHLEPFVRHVGGAEVGLYRAEGEVGALGLARAYAVEKC